LDWLLSLDLSPEQITGRMKLERFDGVVSRQTLYRWIDKLNWRSRLPRKGKRYRKRVDLKASASLIPNRTDIDKRPTIVEQNSELGHWEGDTVYGQDGYFVTLVERVSKIFLSVRVPDKTKKTVGRAIRKLLKPYRSMCKTITFDNGGEFADHATMARALKCKIYFAKPYHSWQRGLNENTNGLLRRYFPKGVAIASLSSQKIKDAIFRINIRPRKALNYLSPIEFLLEKRVSLMLSI
jgi:IS30 family transposase